MNSTPNLNDIVYCHTEKIDKTCIHVKLLEYEDMPGMVIIADATIRKKRKSHCLMKINRKYPLIIKNINNDGSLELSFKYVDKEQVRPFLNYIEKYQKALKVFRYFLNYVERKFSDETFMNYANKSIWKINREKLYDYILDYYLNRNNLELFDFNEEEKLLFDKALFKFFGKLEIKTKYTFSIRNPNFRGYITIMNILNEIRNKFNLDVYIKNIPEYYIQVKSNNEKTNNDLVLEIENYLLELINKNNCLYQKNSVDTNYNI